MKTTIDSDPVDKATPWPQTSLGVYAAMVLISSVVLSLLFVLVGAGTECLWIPVAATLLIFTHLRPMVLVLTLVPIALVRESTYGWPRPNNLWFAVDAWWLCVPTLCLIISSFRFQTLASGIFPRRRKSGRLRFWPLIRLFGLHGDDDLFPRHEAQPIEIGFVACVAMVAFAFSTFLLVNLTTHRDWAVYSGLLPVGLRIVQLTVGTCLVFLVAHSLCCYAQWRQAGSNEAFAFATRELWKWYRSELRTVAQKRRKMKRKERNRTKVNTADLPKSSSRSA